MEAAAYARHLYTDDLDGYLQLAHINEKSREFDGRYVTKETVFKDLSDAQGAVDMYATPNTYYIPKRSSANIRHYRALYVDLDPNKYDKTEKVYLVIIMADEGQIPRPTMIVDSGRGIHLYWKIKHAPAAAAWTWQQLQDYLYKQLKHLGADPVATDGARLLRLPGTVNSRNGELCKILVMNDDCYSMYDLCEKFLDQPKKTKSRRPRSKGQVRHLFNPYSLHQARLSDLLTLCKLRNYDLRGQRNSVIHLFAYWTGLIIRDYDELEQATLDFNQRFKEPLKDTEILAVTRCVPNAIEAFLNDEQPPPGYKQAGYNYSNTRLLEMLEIDQREQQQMKTIINTKEKYRRNNKRRTPRNELGLTSREQQKLDNIAAVKRLKAQGLKQIEIAEELGITQGYISKLLRSK